MPLRKRKILARKLLLARALLAAGLLMAASTAPAQSPAPEPLSAFPQSLLAIRTASGKVVDFKIWEADTPKREEQGLMFIREMDEHTGMLFMFPENHRVSMWMKNTYISLDLLFPGCARQDRLHRGARHAAFGSHHRASHPGIRRA